MAVDRRAARLGVLALVGAMLFGLLGTRLWFIQTDEAAALQAEVDRTKLRTFPLEPQRGRIFDSDGRILADNKRVLEVGVEWDLVRRESQRLEIFRRLSGWVGVPVEDMEARYQRGIDNPFLPLPVASDIDERTAAAILERREDLPGVVIMEEAQRVYPYAPLASHVVGYMGRITRETKEFWVDEKGYSLSERVGQFGVELSMEEHLRGKPGSVTYEVDNRNRIVREVERVPPINGRDVQLTIDLDQQQYAEQALQTMLRIRRDFKARNGLDPETNFEERFWPDFPEEVPFTAPAGAVVLMNHDNGHVVALASYPTFDNRWFEAGLTGDKFKQLFPAFEEDGVTPISPDKSILVNRAISGRYNLGSTFKPFTAYAALNTGLITTEDTFVDEGTYEMTSVEEWRCREGLVKCTYRNAKCPNGRPCVYGTVDVENALAVSSDTFYYRIGEQILVENGGDPVLQDQVRLFGFGEDTGIALPFEFGGTVPDAELKRLYAERGVISVDEGRGYYTGDNLQLAIGQGLLSATPLQLAVGYSTIANYGFVWRPEIIKAIYQPGVPDSEVPGRVDISRAVFAEEPNVSGDLIRQVRMPVEIHDEIDRGLSRVITGPGVTSDYYHRTTGELLFDNYPDSAIRISGKTGTAQGANNYPWNDSSAFAAYSTDPEHPFTAAAYLEKAGYGGSAAAPVVKCMFLQLSGIVPADPVMLSDPLDTNSVLPAEPMELPGTSCFNGTFRVNNVAPEPED